jgi:hypothetical protein
LVASWNYVSVYAPKTSFGIGGASGFGTSAYSDAAGFPLSTTTFTLTYALAVSFTGSG